MELGTGHAYTKYVLKKSTRKSYEIRVCETIAAKARVRKKLFTCKPYHA